MADFNPLSGILSGLGWLLGALVGISKSVATAIQSVGLAVVTLAKATATVFDRVGGYLVNVGGFFGRLFTSIIPQAFAHLSGWLVNIAKTLNRWFTPVVNLLKKVRKTFLKQWNTFVRPVLDTINVVRRTLQVLGFLGVDAAKNLDKKLAAIEAKIEAPMFVILGKINEVLNWVNRIATVDGILQRSILFASIFQYRKQFATYAANSLARPLTDQEQANYDAAYPTKTPAQHVDDLQRAIDGQESYVAVLAQPYIDSYEEMRAA